MTSGLLTCGSARRNWLTNLSWAILDKLLNWYIWDLIFQKRGMTFRTSWILQLHTLSWSVNHQELFAKIVFLQLIPQIALFQSLPKIHDHRWGLEQRPIWKLIALQCLKATILWLQSNTAHAELQCLSNCITHQAMVPESCSNPQMNQQVFKLALKFFSVSGFCEWHHKWCRFLAILAQVTWPWVQTSQMELFCSG